MKNHFLAALFLCASFTGYTQDVSRLSLEQAIDYAIQNQPAFQNYKVDQQIAASKNFESVTRYLPKLNGSFDLRDNLKLGEIALKFPDPVTHVEQDLRIQQGTKYVGTGGVDLSMPLVDMAAISDIKTSKQQQKLSELQVQKAVIDLKVNITRQYYLVLLNTERVKKAESSVQRNQQAYESTKVRFDNQNALKTDLNRAYLNLANAKYLLKISQDSIKTSRAGLAQLIGLPLGSGIELTDSLPVNVKAEVMPEYPDFKAVENNRVEMRTEVMQQSISTMQLHKINYQYIPTLSGYGFIGGQGLDNEKLFRKESWYWNSYIGVRLSIPIFDGLQKTALAQQQKLAVRKNDNNILNLRLTISYQVQTTSVNYSNAFDNLQLIKENVTLAEDVVKDINTRYKNSLATYQELLDGENTLKETEFNYFQALYMFLVAELEWKKANGKM